MKSSNFNTVLYIIYSLKCEICISPLVIYEIDTIEWYFNSSSNSNVTNELIQSTQHILVSQNNKHLKMYNIQVYIMRTTEYKVL